MATMRNLAIHPMSHSLIRALLTLPILFCIASGLLKLPYTTARYSVFGRACLKALSAVLKCGEFCNKLALLMIVSALGQTAFRNRKQAGSTWAPDLLGSASFKAGPPLLAKGSF